MGWTSEKLARIPEVYRDFMTVLQPVIDSRKPDVVLKMTAIPFGMIVSALSAKYPYDSEQVRAVADNLRRKGYVEEDHLGFFIPTGPGEELIHALRQEEAVVAAGIPPLPDF